MTFATTCVQNYITKHLSRDDFVRDLIRKTCLIIQQNGRILHVSLLQLTKVETSNNVSPTPVYVSELMYINGQFNTTAKGGHKNINIFSCPSQLSMYYPYTYGCQNAKNIWNCNNTGHINPYLTNGFSHRYHLGQSTFILRGVRSDF